MIRSLILVTQPEEVRPFAAILAAHNPALAIHPATDRDELRKAWAAAGNTARLITLLTGVIVPSEILEALELPGYNFHPGPPAYPGRYPAPFALYDGAAQFGATVHELAVKVDSGPIVDVEIETVPAGADLRWFIDHTYRLVMRAFLRLAPHLATSTAALPHLPLPWGDRQCSRGALEEICKLPENLPATEKERRARAFGHLRPHLLG